MNRTESPGESTHSLLFVSFLFLLWLSFSFYIFYEGVCVCVCALCTFYCSINNTLCLSFIDCTKRFFLRFPKRVCTILTSNKQNQTDVSSTHQLPILMKTKNIQQQQKNLRLGTWYTVHLMKTQSIFNGDCYLMCSLQIGFHCVHQISVLRMLFLFE